jgi:hypothetical protein
VQQLSDKIGIKCALEIMPNIIAIIMIMVIATATATATIMMNCDGCAAGAI